MISLLPSWLHFSLTFLLNISKITVKSPHWFRGFQFLSSHIHILASQQHLTLLITLFWKAFLHLAFGAPDSFDFLSIHCPSLILFCLPIFSTDLFLSSSYKSTVHIFPWIFNRYVKFNISEIECWFPPSFLPSNKTKIAGLVSRCFHLNKFFFIHVVVKEKP